MANSNYPQNPEYPSPDSQEQQSNPELSHDKVKGLKIGEVFICLNEKLLASIKKHGLLPRKLTEQKRSEGSIEHTEEIDQASLPRKYITQANEIIDSLKPNPDLPARQDSVFAFVFRGKLNPPTDLSRQSRSTVLIHNLSGKELVADGALVDEVVGRLQHLEEGRPHPMAGFTMPRDSKIKLDEEQTEKYRLRINEVAKEYWAKMVPLDIFLKE